jgi:ABC-2 type transport system permease protein
MHSHLFKGTGRLIKLIFRQERLKIFIWLAGLIVVTLAVAAAYPNVYIDQESRLAYALTMNNPAMTAMLGPGYALEDYIKVGPILGTDMLLFTAIAVAIMNILFVGRGTRADEEDGRLELVRSLPVGRLSYLSAAMIAAIITNMLLAVLLGFGLYALKIEGIDLASSFLYGANLGAIGLVFAAFTALFAQLAETSRGATMFSFTALGVAYLVRAVGDVGNETLSFFSPLGWAVRTQVFVGDHWWPVFLSLALTVVIVVVSFYLNSIRDLGSGFISAGKGKEHASPFLQTAFGLNLRLQFTNIAAWAIGIFVISAACGAVLGDLEAYFSDMDFLQAYLANDTGQTMTEQFIALMVVIMSMVSAVPAVVTMLKLKGEEDKNRTEHFYGRAVSRTKVMGSYFLLAILVSIVMQLLVALGLWSVGASVMEDALAFGTTFSSALVYLPAIWIMIGLAVLFVGAAPKAAGLVWFYVVFCFIIVYLGGVFDFPVWVNNIYSFEHVPQIPADDIDYMPLIVMTIISIVLTIIGFIGYNKRDIQG